MGLAEFEDTLKGIRKLAIDTAPIIYFVEGHDRYQVYLNSLFRQISSGRLVAYTSVVTLLEILSLGQNLSDRIAQDVYRNLLFRCPNFYTIPIKYEELSEVVTRQMEEYGLGVPEAIQLAVASTQGCDAFLTHSKKFDRVKEIKIILLEDYL